MCSRDIKENTLFTMAKREIPKGFPLLNQLDFSRKSEFH